MCKYILQLFILILFISCQETENQKKEINRKTKESKNVVFILSDDHRYDFMGFTGKVPFLKTPAMDRMATEGVHMKNAFVSTALCSPSRASILTGQYAHRHGVVDNQSLVSDTAQFFPELLQDAGYETAFIGKWHMGEHHANPRKGFNYWASFKGQGQYYNPVINKNGENISHKDSAYIADVLTDYADDFLDQRDTAKPFFMYLSHKSVHADFKPAPRHNDTYLDAELDYPPTMDPPKSKGSGYNYEDLPDWVKKQRNSWHGVDYMYHGQIKFDEFYKKYCETLLALDESIQAVLDRLEKLNLLDNTIVFYMGDNGFSFGEHGLIDKRHAYEESMRVPLLVYAPGMQNFSGNQEAVVQNVDIAPTILDIAGVTKPPKMDGSSFFPILAGEEMAWRDTIYYEYFWERPFPQTPTTHAIRTDRYKYIRYHGIWDINELYDLKNDPWEMNNLIRDPQYVEISKQLREKLFDWLDETNGQHMLLKRDLGRRFDHKYRGTF